MAGVSEGDGTGDGMGEPDSETAMRPAGTVIARLEPGEAKLERSEVSWADGLERHDFGLGQVAAVELIAEDFGG